MSTGPLGGLRGRHKLVLSKNEVVGRGETRRACFSVRPSRVLLAFSANPLAPLTRACMEGARVGLGDRSGSAALLGTTAGPDAVWRCRRRGEAVRPRAFRLVSSAADGCAASVLPGSARGGTWEARALMCRRGWRGAYFPALFFYFLFFYAVDEVGPADWWMGAHLPGAPV